MGSGGGGNGGAEFDTNSDDSDDDDDDDDDNDDSTPMLVTSPVMIGALRVLRESVVLTLLVVLEELDPTTLSNFFLRYALASRFFVWAVADAARPIERAELRKGWAGIGCDGGPRSIDASSPSIGAAISMSAAEHTGAADSRGNLADAIVVSLSARAPPDITSRSEDEAAYNVM